MANTDLKNALIYFSGDVKTSEFIKALSQNAPFLIKGLVYSAISPRYDIKEYVLLAKKYKLSLVMDLTSYKIENEDILSAVKGDLSLKFISDDVETLRVLKEKFPRAEFLAASKFFDVTIVPSVLTNNFAVNIYYDKLTFERIRDLHALNIKVFCYGVKQADVAALLTYYGVDGIITDEDKILKKENL